MCEPCAASSRVPRPRLIRDQNTSIDHVRREDAEQTALLRSCFQSNQDVKISYLSCDKRRRNADGCLQEDCRPPILLIHGLGFNATYWSCLARKLCPFANVFAIDLPNSGESGPLNSEQITTGSLLEIINEWAAHLSLDRFFLVGHGIGALAALTYAAAFPGKVIRAAVSGANPQPFPFADPSYQFATSPDLVQFLGQMLEPGSNICSNATILANIADPFDETCVKALATQYANSMEQFRAYQQFLATTNIRPVLSAITSPILIMAGTRDPAVPVGASGLLRESIAKSALVEFYDAGSNIPILHTTRYNDTLYDFFFVQTDVCSIFFSETVTNSAGCELDCEALASPCSAPCPPLALCGQSQQPRFVGAHRARPESPECQKSPARHGKMEIPCRIIR